jgi:hypothetical protein
MNAQAVEEKGALFHMAVKRIVQINCPEGRAQRDVACLKCNLPLKHHGVRFEVLEYDDLYDVYALHAVQSREFNPNASVSTRLMVLHVSGQAFTKFKEFV